MKKPAITVKITGKDAEQMDVDLTRLYFQQRIHRLERDLLYLARRIAKLGPKKCAKDGTWDKFLDTADALEEIESGAIAPFTP